MALSVDTYSRISKLQVDLQELSPEEVAMRRAKNRLALVGGPELLHSASLQAGLLSAAATASRCFPGAVEFHIPKAEFDPQLLVRYPAPSLLVALQQLNVTVVPPPLSTQASLPLVFGTRLDIPDGLQVTFDSWIGGVGPVDEDFRLAERPGCVLAGVLAGALGVGELFLRFAGITQLAGLRQVGISLWHPGLPWTHKDAAGPPIEVLPAEFWLLGLGHLGQAYLWTLGLLPFKSPERVNLLLNDFDTAVAANHETGLLTTPSHVGQLKTRIANAWLEQRGFRVRLLERRFDDTLRRQTGEPRLALCGFDGSGPRWALEEPGFSRVVECGLGGQADNFDTIALHTFPQPLTTPRMEWPPDQGSDQAQRAQRLATRNKVYREHAAAVGCGQFELAGKSVAVPFVGAVAASLVLAETLRMLHEGERCSSLRLQLDAPSQLHATYIDSGYRGREQPALEFQEVKP